jgi:hypothetical protein
MRRAGWLLAGLCLIGACSDDRPDVPGGSQEPTAGGVGLPEVDSGHPDDDAGTQDAAVDAGPALPVYTCERVEVLGSSGGDTPNETSTDTPADFMISRQAVSWQCDPDRITISLSDGSCPRGAGHELTIELSMAAIQDMVLRLGNNPVLAESDSGNMRVRYTRPKRLADPSGTWGNCLPADGQLIFLEAPELKARALLQARFSMMLPACDDSGNPPYLVAGAFKITLRHDPSEACAGELP